MANETVSETNPTNDPELEFTAATLRQIVDELDLCGSSRWSLDDAF